MDQLYYTRQMQLQAEVISLLVATDTDVSSGMVIELFKDLAEGMLGDRKKWANKSYNPYRGNTIESIYSQIQQGFITNSELIAPILKACWDHNLPCVIDSYTVTPLITKKCSSSEEVIKHLDQLGLLSEAKEYYPLSLKLPGRNLYKVGRIEHPMISLSGKIPQIDHWKEAVEVLSKRKKGRFGSLLTAASISKNKKQQRELVNLAFKDYAKELATLPDSQIFAIYSSFKRFLTIDMASENKDLIRLNTKFNKIQEKESEARIASTIVDLKSGKLFSGSQGNFQALDSVVDILINIPEDKINERTEVVRLFEAAFNKNLMKGGSYTYYGSSSGIVDSLYDTLISKTLSKMKERGASEEEMMMFVAAIVKDEELEPKTQFNVSTRNTLEGLVANRTKEIRDDSNKFSGKNHHLQLNELAKKWEKYPKSTFGVARGSLLLEYAGNSSWDISIDDPIIQEWKKKSVTEDLFKTLYLIAQMKCKGELSVQENRSRDLAIQHIGDKEIPGSLRLHFVTDYLRSFKKVIENEEFINVMLDLQKDYFNGKRSARTELQRHLLASYSSALDEFSTKETLLAGTKLLDLWETAARKPLKGENSKIYEGLASEAVTLSTMTNKLDTLQWLFSKSNDLMRGKVPVLTELIKLGNFDLAKRLLPLPNKPYPTWQNDFDKKYDAKLESKLNEFKNFLNDPMTFFRLECELLYLKDEDGEGAPKKSAYVRTKRLSEECSIDSKWDEKVKVEALVALTLCHNGHAINAAHIEKIIGTKTFKENLIDRRNSRSNRYPEWRLHLHIGHAMNEMKKGNYEPLELIVSTIEDTKNDQTLQYEASNFHRILSLSMCLPVIECVRNQNPEELDELLKLLRRLADHAFTNGYTGNLSCTSPLAYAKLVSDKLSRRKELDTWCDTYSPDVKKLFKAALGRANIPVYVSWAVKDSVHWLNMDNKEYRMDLFHWVYCNKVGVGSLVMNPMWAAGYIPNKGVRKEEVDELISSDTIILSAKKLLILSRARVAFKEGNYAIAIEECNLVRTLIDEQNDDEKFNHDHSIYDDSLVYGARSHIGLGQEDKALKLMKSLRSKQGFPGTREARKKLLKEFGITK